MNVNVKLLVSVILLVILIKYYGFGARLAYDTEWRAYILKGLGIEVPKK